MSAGAPEKRRKKRRVYIEANPGPQTEFLASEADIAIYGGEAGGGKTFGLLLAPVPYMNVKGFGGVIFRRQSTHITGPGGIWDESVSLYKLLGAKETRSDLKWKFPAGTTIAFRHLQHEKDVDTWQGPSLPFIGFDELTQFTETQFFFLVGRNRSTCGVKPYVRATCNPIPDDDPIGGWVHRLIQWWIDPVTGFAIPERSGLIKWVVRRRNEFHYGDTREEVYDKTRDPNLPDDHPKQPKPLSLTFVKAGLADNPQMADKDPEYAARLEFLPQFLRERMAEGNWNAKLMQGNFFRVGKVEIIDAAPAGLKLCRAWDLAYTEGAGDYTVGAKLGMDTEGFFYILDIIRGQWETGYRDRTIKQTAELDRCRIRIPQDPAAGKSEATRLTRMLAGHIVRGEQPRKDKAERASGFASQLNAGNVKMVRAPWNAGLISRLDMFPSKNIPDDEIDALSDAFNELVKFKTNVLIATAPGNTRPEQAKKQNPYGALIQKDGGDSKSTDSKGDSTS